MTAAMALLVGLYDPFHLYIKSMQISFRLSRHLACRGFIDGSLGWSILRRRFIYSSRLLHNGLR
jgi:hypothetical protein